MIAKKQFKLEDFSNWKKGDGDSYFSLFDYLGVKSQDLKFPIDIWVAFSEIFVPQFVEKHGHILIEECYKQKEKDYFRYLNDGLSKEKVEYWINNVCLDGLLYDIPGETEVISNFIGARIKLSWEMKLKNDFPSRRFSVSLLKDDDVGDLTITFFENT